MADVMQQNPDGAWSPSQPVPLSNDLDFEVYGTGPYRWEAMRGMDTVATGHARTSIGLAFALRRAKRKHDVHH